MDPDQFYQTDTGDYRIAFKMSFKSTERPVEKDPAAICVFFIFQCGKIFQAFPQFISDDRIHNLFFPSADLGQCQFQFIAAQNTIPAVTDRFSIGIVMTMPMACVPPFRQTQRAVGLLLKQTPGPVLCFQGNISVRSIFCKGLICIKKKNVCRVFRDLTEDLFDTYLYSKNVPDPELIIRPSGEQRTSNFLLWQSAYSEYVFMDVLWPDFGPADLDKAIEEYHRRNRRFGGV